MKEDEVLEEIQLEGKSRWTKLDWRLKNNDEIKLKSIWYFRSELNELMVELGFPLAGATRDEL